MLRRVSFRRLSLSITLLSLALLSPVLFTGLVADDYLHQLLLREDPGVNGLEYRPLDLFRFVNGDPQIVRALIGEGVFPWWTDPETRISFFRPLSSLTHAIDHALWPSNPFLMHVQSLLWFSWLVGIVGALYRTLGYSPLFAAFCLLLFALDDARAPVAGWIANRNAIIAACFSLLAVLAFIRFRSEGRRRQAWLGPVFFFLGLLAGETAIAVSAYLVAYTLYLDRSRWPARLAALSPYIGVLLAWKLLNVLLGYGVTGSGVYVDPLSSPIHFVWAAGERLPVLALALFAAPFADLWEIYPLTIPELRWIVMLGAAVLLGLLGLALRRLWQRDARVRFWTLGCLLALLPLCATFPHDRLLLVPGVGAMALIAVLLEAAWQKRAQIAPALGGAALALFHLILAPVLLPLRAASIDSFDEVLRASDRTLPSAPAIEEKVLVLLNPPLDPFASYLPVYREAVGLPRPRQQLWLATGASDLRVTPLDNHRIELRPTDGFLSVASEQMLRKPGSGPTRGEHVQLDGVEFVVTEITSDGRPQTVVVHFQAPLSDPRWVWMSWDGSGYSPFLLPPEGQGITLPRAHLGSLLLGS